MALQSFGPISIGDIAAEFGGAAPHSLSEYYGVDDGIPTSGIISISDFYGASADTGVELTCEVSGTLVGYSLASSWGAIDPDPYTVNSTNLTGLFQSAGKTNYINVYLAGNLPVDHFVSMTTPDDTYLTNAVPQHLYLSSIDATAWIWVIPSVLWVDQDIIPISFVE